MGRILGIDYGDVRVGLALSDTTKLIASPFKTIKNINLKLLISELSQIIIEKNVDSIVLGLPIGMKGQDTHQTVKVKDFANSLSIFTIPIFFEDERLSSVEAEKSLALQKVKIRNNKEMIDQRAAAIILQKFLDYHIE